MTPEDMMKSGHMFAPKLDGLLRADLCDHSVKQVAIKTIATLIDPLTVMFQGVGCNDDACMCQLEAMQKAAADGDAPFKTIEIVAVQVSELELADG